MLRSMRKIATFGLPIAAALAIAGCASVGNSEGQSHEREKAKLGNPSSPAIERVALEGPEGLRDFVYPAFKGQPVLNFGLVSQIRDKAKSPLVGQDPACIIWQSANICDVTPESVGLHAMMSLWHAATVPASEVPLSSAALFLSEKRFKEWGLAVEEEGGLMAPDNPPWPNQRYDAGDNNFERRNLRQRFEDELVPELKPWGKSLQRRVWMVGRVTVGDYQLDKGAFLLKSRGSYMFSPQTVENGGGYATPLSEVAPDARSALRYRYGFTFVRRWWVVPEDKAREFTESWEGQNIRHLYLAIDVTVRPHAFADSQNWHDVPQDKYGQPLDPVVEVHRHVLYRDKGLTKRVEPNWDATRVQL